MRRKSGNFYKLIAIALLGLIGSGFIFLLVCRNSAGITPDSVAYISVARNLTEGNGFVTYDGAYFVLQPPLYPLLLAGIKILTSVDPLVSAAYLNALLFGLIVFLSGSILLKHLKSFTLVFLGTGAVLISYALVQASFMALSELLFILLVLLFLYNLEIFLSKRSYTSFLIISISAALACLTRYTGVIIILTGIICILLWGRNNLKKMIRHSFIFSLITILPIGSWVFRNYLISGTLAGHRAASSYTLFENLGFFFGTVFPWYFPINLSVLFFILLILIVTIWFLFKLEPAKLSDEPAIKLIGPSLFFVVFYTGVIVISSTTTAYDQISDRLLSPVYIPLVFILFYISDKIIGWKIMYFNLRLKTGLFALGILLLMFYPAWNTAHIIKDYMELSGWGYSCNIWTESQTINFLIHNEMLGKSYTLYSNEPEAVYILTNLKTNRSPAKTYYNSPQPLKINPNPKDIWLKSEKVCLIWFDKTDRTFLYTIDELQQNKNMTKVAHLKDGEIYTFSGQ